jgi:FkbM family methyltransferase
MAYFDFIEIGANDHGTELQKADPGVVGLTVEPLDFYLQQLPDKENVFKVNKAISDRDGMADIFYIHPDDIKKYNLMPWLRDCNMIGEVHPSLKPAVRRYPHILQKRSVEMMSFGTLARHFGIEGIGFLKVDTEGHDCVIMQSLIDYCHQHAHVYPAKIRFESISHLKDEDRMREYERVLAQLVERGYRVIRKGWDTMLVKAKR